MHPLDYIKALDHHAYFIHSFKDSVTKLKDFLKEKFNIHSHQNPDFYHEKFEVLGIEDSRKIKEIHVAKAFSPGGKRIFLIEASSITHEAQNALLKIFEEPNEDSHFFLMMPSPHTLLPTLRSRLHIVRSPEEAVMNAELIDAAETFLKLSPKEKIEFVDEMAKDISDEKRSKSDALDFLSALENAAYQKKDTKALKAILKARDYLQDRSPSLKQLLEYVALNL